MGVSFALQAAGAAAQYGATRAQAKAGKASADLQAEQLRVEAQTTALRAREEEAERLRRAGLIDGEVTATAAAFGVDPFSGSAQQLRGENERMAEADVSTIRMLGAARGRQLAIAGRSNALERQMYSNMGKTAWVRPVLGLIGAGVSAATSMLGPGGGTPTVQPERITGRVGGPI
jgi:hypothetical protein